MRCCHECRSRSATSGASTATSPWWTTVRSARPTTRRSASSCPPTPACPRRRQRRRRLLRRGAIEVRTPGQSHDAGEEYGTQTEHWNGVDINVNARTSNGIQLQGGMSTGRTSTNNCEVIAQVAGSPLRRDVLPRRERRLVAVVGMVRHPAAVPHAGQRARRLHDPEDRGAGERDAPEQAGHATRRPTTTCRAPSPLSRSDDRCPAARPT